MNYFRKNILNLKIFKILKTTLHSFSLIKNLQDKFIKFHDKSNFKIIII